MFVTISRSTQCVEPTRDPIHLITQFYKPSQPDRLAELQFALSQNAKNPAIDSITLLNEQFYTPEELGVSSNKIEQVIIGHRLRFGEAFAHRKPGYTVVANSDIFLDDTLVNVRKSDIHLRRAMYALLRYEYPSGQLYGPRADSNDTWIFHNTLDFNQKVFNFELGVPGCDNKLCYLFTILGVEVYNDPLFIKTHHCHASPERKYPAALDPPYLFVCPAQVQCSLFGHSLETLRSHVNMYDFVGCNERLCQYLTTETRNFIIPRIAGIENETSLCGVYNQAPTDALVRAMKTNAGIRLSTGASVAAYSRAYMTAFDVCRMYASWEPWGNYIRHIAHSHSYIQQHYPKPQVSSCAFEVFHYLAKPWTHALRGKTLLIISPFVDQMQSQPPVYATPLFPDCKFVYLKPPQTHGTEPSRDWELEFKDLCAQVSKLSFDVALCSCGGYGNPLCAFIFSLGKSAIYVGGVLQMYFGIYGNRWLKERKEVVAINITPDWRRPVVKPHGHAAIENACYW